MAEILLVETLPYVEARGGLFHVLIEGRDMAFTPHMFLACTQLAQRTYTEWVREQCEVVRDGARVRHG